MTLAALALVVALAPASAEPPVVEERKPDWFAPPQELAGCTTVDAPRTRHLWHRYECGDAWVDVFIYDPVLMGLTTRVGESSIDAEAREFLETTASTLVEQGMYDSLQFDEPRPLCYEFGRETVPGLLVNGTGARRGRMVFTSLALFAVKGMTVKLRATGTRAWRFDPLRVSEALLREAIRWDLPPAPPR